MPKITEEQLERLRGVIGMRISVANGRDAVEGGVPFPVTIYEEDLRALLADHAELREKLKQCSITKKQN